MIKGDLKHVTLSTPIYHPILGSGLPTMITNDSIKVKFKEGCEDTFTTSGSVVDCKLISVLYLYPVKVIKSEDNE